MAELPIKSHALKHAPDGPGGADGFRWHVHLSEEYAGEGRPVVDYLVVDLSGSEALREASALPNSTPPWGQRCDGWLRAV